MKKIQCLIFLVFCCFMSFGQDCDLRLETARSYKKMGEYKQAVAWYKKVLNDCGDYDGKVKTELQECQRKSKPERTTSDYVPVEQPGLRLNDTQIFFEAEGGNDAHIHVICEGQWVVNVTKGKEWLDVVKNGELLVVDCHPNTESEQRDGIIYIIAGEGTIVAKITVQQEEGRSAAYTLPAIQESLKGEIVFENGEATPIFDYKKEDLINMVDHLKRETHLGLQVEMPWCRNQYNMKLLEQRYENIVCFFVVLGVNKEKISCYLYKNNENKADACDEVYLSVFSVNNENTSAAKSQGSLKTADERDEALMAKRSYSTKEKPVIRELSEVFSKTEITFDKDSDIPQIYDLNDNLNRIVAIMKANPTFGLQIEGYVDNTGSEEHQRDLAQRRANRVKQLFIDKGVPANQISTVSYTVNDPHFKQNIPEERRNEANCAIFRILVN